MAGPVSPNLGPPEFDIAVIGTAWKLVQQNLANWAIALLLIGVIGFAMSLPVSLALQSTSLAPRPGTFPTLQQMLIQQLIMLPISMMQQSFQMGLFRLALNQLRGLPTSPVDIFDFKGQYPQVLLGVIVFQFAVLIGLPFLILPGLLIATLLIFTNILVIDKKLPAIDAARLSFSTVLPHMWIGMGVIFVASLASFLGFFACCIGLFATVPIFWMTISIHYIRFFCQPGSSGTEATAPSYTL